MVRERRSVCNEFDQYGKVASEAHVADERIESTNNNHGHSKQMGRELHIKRKTKGPHSKADEKPN